MRWWHLAELEPIEAQLFGDERWSAAMFWNELANAHHYLVALDDGEVVGYAGLSVTGAERGRCCWRSPWTTPGRSGSMTSTDSRRSGSGAGTTSQATRTRW